MWCCRSQDYKRVRRRYRPEYRRMGGEGPVPFADTSLWKDRREVITYHCRIQQEKRITRAFFYSLIKVGHEPLVIEIQLPLGTPETEVVIPP